MGLALFSITACGGGSGGGGGGRPAYSCIERSYTNSVAISGTAEYEFRIDGNGAVSPTRNPIRNAEIKVLNSGGSVIQCAYTNSDGTYLVNVPPSSANHTIRVSSVIFNSTTKAFVFNNPWDYALHYVETTFTPDTSKTLNAITALATGDVKGGAFNILDKIHTANEFLVNETNNCTNLSSACTPFPGAPAVDIFWEKGVNPGEYTNNGPLSFYLPGERELYILGGESGDVNSSDCDHFDNSIIIHEYGHFLEDVFSDSDSQGGPHFGDTILDPRLAWSEGWANFFQAAVLNNPVYRDTSGNSDIGGLPWVLFNENLELPDNDIASTMGEGNFREFSISRLLWDAIDLTDEGPGVDEVNSPFAELWTVFSSATAGIKSANYRFRNVGLFHHLQKALPGAADWSSIRTGENHADSERDYARGVTRGGVCAGVVIEPQNISLSQTENGSILNSNQFASNDFYQIYHEGGNFNLAMNYTTDPLDTADLDVFIYKSDYIFGQNSVGSGTASINPGASVGAETVNISSLPAGYYMINVRVDTSGGLSGSSTYSLTLGGQNLCPN